MVRSGCPSARRSAVVPRCALSLIAVLASVHTWAGQDDSKAQVDLLTQDDSWKVPEELALRARVTAITPAETVNIEWRHGGEGLGGTVIRGTLGEKLAVGDWSPAVPVMSFVKGQFPRKLFLTFTTGRGGKLTRGQKYGYYHTEGGSTNVELEFEFSWQGRVIKTFKEAGPDGGTTGIVIPAYRLAGGRTPDSPEFVNELSGLLDYARQRAARQESLPWSKGPFPRRFSIITDVHGYGTGIYYGTRFTNKAVLEAECHSLRMLGVNGFAGPPLFLQEMATGRAGFARDFNRALYLQLGGYPVPRTEKNRAVPEAGCAFAPGVAARSKEMIESGLAEALGVPVDEIWWRTEDEIGAVEDRAPEGKRHLALCPHCAEGLRAYLKSLGRTPADFGQADWGGVRPMDIWGKEAPALNDKAAALLAYHTSMFLNYSSASLFTPLRDSLASANEETRRSPDKKRPLVYSFALRGNTFLMGGHSLDFFDFYRLADNAFVFETSNRDARIWSLDSYLFDVGRMVSAQQNLKFGVYVKPHRGAVIQRTLSAVGRNAQMLYWYTYGPDYSKGDTFAEKDEALEKTSRAAYLLGKTEDVLYNSSWQTPAEVAIVNPRSAELWARMLGASPASYENAKWVYTALTHAHVPLDPLDEVMLATQDLSRYRVIYVSGQNLTQAAAARLVEWVKAGGTLYTSGGGLARDEANQPLAVMEAALGLQARGPVEMWYKVSPYGATGLESYNEPVKAIAPVPAGAEVLGAAPFNTTFKALIGREVLRPLPGTEVLAKFADGGAAVTRCACGKGRAYVAGFFPGLEYSAAVRTDKFNMARDFDAGLRSFISAAALERVRPVVDAKEPTVEALLLKNKATGKRAVILMNWAYQVAGKRLTGKGSAPLTQLVPFNGLKITIRGAGEVSKATSAILDKPLPLKRGVETLTVTLPELDDGDVLLLE